jgi:CobQ-like glutamine amidotransferase family enzyme
MKIVHLYPTLMGTYGDWGNTLAIKHKLELNGIKPVVEVVNPNDKIPYDANLYILGGGEDFGQELACKFLSNDNILQKILSNSSAKLFVICAGLQIIGTSYEVAGVKNRQGLELVDFKTKRLEKRAVGEVLLKSAQFGTITGYENHGGGTILSNNIKPLGTVKYGIGNGFNQKNDGFITNNIIGTYLHGPVLSRNPLLLNFLIEKSFNIKIKTEQNGYIDKLRNERIKSLNIN